MLLDQNQGHIEDLARPVLTGSGVSGGKAISDGGASSLLPSLFLDPTRYTNDPPGPSIVTDFRERALQRLISRTVPKDELPPIIEAIFSSRKTTDMIDRLQESDAQAFIDVIDEVRHQTLYFRGMG